MAIYEVDPSEFENRAASCGTDGGLVSGASEEICQGPGQREQENAEQMEFLRMGIEEGLASGSSASGLLERLHAYFDEATAENPEYLRPHPSR